jgi:hypothetical protein
MGVCEEILAEDLERDLDHPDGCDLPGELGETRAWVHGIASDQAIEVGRLSRQLVWLAGILTNLGLSPIEDIPQLLKTTQDALPVVALVLKCLQDALDSDAGPWD